MIPEFLKEKIKEQYGKEIAEKILQGYKEKRKTTLRVNTIKADVETIKNKLKENNIEYKEVNWGKEALIIENATEEDIRKLEMYENGEIYLQSLSSMLPPIILEPQEKSDILDMTAAPGGKTTQIAALTRNNAQITACEMNNIRIDKLKYNIQKQGASSVYIMQTDSRKIDDLFSFSQILLDAPCSGSGTILESDAKTEKYFTPKLIEKSVKTQTELIKKAVKILKKGGTMVYSTCSILKEENEEIVSKVLKQGKVEIEPIKPELIAEMPILPTNIQGTLCVCPNKEFEGFFVAKLKKL